jgi:hypothetical protein
MHATQLLINYLYNSCQAVHKRRLQSLMTSVRAIANSGTSTNLNSQKWHEIKTLFEFNFMSVSDLPLILGDCIEQLATDETEGEQARREDYEAEMILTLVRVGKEVVPLINVIHSRLGQSFGRSS